MLGAGFVRNHRPCATYLLSSNDYRLENDGNAVSATNPVAFGDGDKISLLGVYIADPANLP